MNELPTLKDWRVLKPNYVARIDLEHSYFQHAHAPIFPEEYAIYLLVNCDFSEILKCLDLIIRIKNWRQLVLGFLCWVKTTKCNMSSLRQGQKGMLITNCSQRAS